MKSHFTKLWRKRARRASAVQTKPLYRLGRGLEALEDRRLLAFTTPIINFEGQQGGILDPSNAVQVPDTIGDVDDKYFIQAVNHALLGTSIVIYNKSDGSVALGPISMNGLATNPNCQAGLGDPMVAYDHLADRWVLGQFAPDLVNDTDHRLCFFVSQTSDVTDNRWFEYVVPTQLFPDYPHLAVTGEGYVVATNEQGTSISPGAYVLDRENMIKGLPMRPAQRFGAPPDLNLGFQSLTPADLDGPSGPAHAGAYFLRKIDDELGDPPSSNILNDFLEIWELQASFDDPAQSSFRLIQSLLIDDFDGDIPGFTSIEQPGTTIELDAVPEVIMHRVQYRNFGTHETMVGNFTFDINGDDDGGIRWFELRREAGESSWFVHQEGDFSPDANEYWLGSIAMDGQGNIALGYNVSSSSVSPSLRYVGRRATDPLGLMTTQQVTIGNGLGSHATNRWGDYAAMVVDPKDDMTFWFTGEYARNGNWGTRIAAFSFETATTPPNPPTPPVQLNATGLVWNDRNANGIRNVGDAGVAGIRVFVDLDRDGRVDFNEPSVKTGSNGRYKLPALPPGTYDVRVVLPPSWQQTSPLTGPQSITITSAGVNPSSVDFGITGGNLFDFGNSAGTQTAMANNGARHGILAGFQLGATLDGEADAKSNDVNDGITFSQVIGDSPVIRAGQTVTIQADVRLGGQARGYLQGWVDLNRDGDFSDAGEKVISDVRLGQGLSNVSFTVPAGATTGTANMRFRYGFETGIGPTGAAMAGEVEDYTVTVLGNVPLAVDDSFTVPQDDNRLLNVLANDFASSAGGLRLLSVQSPTEEGGTAVIQNGQILYTAPPGFSGIDSFTYTVTDNSGATDSATVTITVAPTFTQPVAVDDQAQASSNSGSTSSFVDIDVLENDILPDPADTRITAIPVLPSNGAAVIITFNNADPTDDVIRYTPNPDFVGIDQFTYRITDGDGNSSTAVVTVFVGDTEIDDKVRYSVQFRTIAGTPITQIQEGQEFLAVVRVRDARLDNLDPTDDVPPEDLGVFAAYLDLLYRAEHVTLVGLPVFNGDYTQDPEFSTDLPGLIDEAGAFRSPDDPFANLPGDRVLFTARFRANALPPDNPNTPTDDQLVTVFNTDPPEQIDPGPGVGDHDTTLYVPAQKVPIDEITYQASPLTIFRTGTSPAAGEGENPLHNYAVANDVNADARVNNFDILLVMNRILRGDGEGEASAEDKRYYDTNNDGRVSVGDILSILSHLLQRGSGEGEATEADELFVAASSSIDGAVIDTSMDEAGWTAPLAESHLLTTAETAPVAADTAENDSDTEPALPPPTFAREAHEEALAQWLDTNGNEQFEDDFFEQLLAGWNG